MVQVPDFGERFWVYQIVDTRTDSFASLGKMYGTTPGFYLLAGPGWEGETGISGAPSYGLMFRIRGAMRLWSAVVLAVVVLVTAGIAVASTPSTRAAGATFDPRWRVISHGGVSTNGRYTLVAATRPKAAGTLIDEDTGRRTVVLLPRGCGRPIDSTPMLGDSWLLADCARGRLGLYSLAGHRWRSVAIALSCRHFRGSCQPYAVGTDWIEYDEFNVHSGDRFAFQSIATGALRRIPTDAKTLPDLDSPALARRICNPLRVPSEGTVVFDGRFAIVTAPEGTFLERCGTRLHLVLSAWPEVATAPGVILGLPSPMRALRGIFLPSLRSFTVAPPRGADMADLELSARHMYIVGQARNGTTDVWSAAAPVPPS